MVDERFEEAVAAHVSLPTRASSSHDCFQRKKKKKE
jgi:hypothetical protein